jgi:hypothetical protein
MEILTENDLEKIIFGGLLKIKKSAPKRYKKLPESRLSMVIARYNFTCARFGIAS